MELISNKCPNCCAMVTFRGDGIAECEWCGSLFTVHNPAGATPSKEAKSKEKEPASEKVFRKIDLEKFSATQEKLLGECMDLFVASRMETSEGKKIDRKIRQNLNIGANERIYAFADTTMMHSGKKGFAILDRGFVMADEDRNDLSYTWEKFANSKIEYEGSGGKVIVDDHYLVSNSESAKAMAQYLKRLRLALWGKYDF